MMTKLNP